MEPKELTPTPSESGQAPELAAADTKRDDYPVVPLVVVLVLTAGLCACLAWNSLHSYYSNVTTQQRHIRFEELRGTILQLDEVLTMSARMAATTGSRQWEDRYKHYESQLDSAIKEVMRIESSETLIQYAGETNAANEKLVEMEHQAFDLVQRGKLEEAQTILASSQYEEQKKRYGDGMSKMMVLMEEGLTASREAAYGKTLRILLATLVAAAVATWAWVIALRSLRRWQCGLNQAVKERLQAEAKLHAHQIQLEARVRERTADLTAEVLQRKRVEQALRDGENKYSALFESNRDAIMTLEPPSWRFTSGNPATVKMFGAKNEEEFVSCGPWDLSPERQPDGRASGEKAKEMIETAMREGSHFFEWMHRRAGGAEFPADVLLTRMQHGEKAILQATVRDISERRRAEEELRRSEARHRALFENMSSGVAVYEAVGDGEDFVFRDFNAAAARIEKVTREDVIGKSVRTCFPGVVEFGLFAVLQRVWKTGVPECLRAAHYHDERIDGWRENHVCKLPSGEVVAVYDDVTERKHAEEELKSRNILLSTQQEASLDGILAVDENGHMMSFNRRFVEMWDIPADVLAQRSDEAALNAVLGKLEHPGEFVAKVQQLYESKQETSRDEILLTDGRSFDRYSAPMLAVDGKYYGRVWYFRDITARKRAEKRTARLSKLKETLLCANSLPERLQRITDAVVDVMDADFARIWITKPGDRCQNGCPHAAVTEGPHVCRHRDRCLHLLASSGRYTHTEGGHARVPFGCYKIGLVAAGKDRGFTTNDVTHDSRVHNHAWAAEAGLVSFAGRSLRSLEGDTIGVLALFSKSAITAEDEAVLEQIADITSRVIQAAKADEELRKGKEAAEAANRAKSTFLANMSHELRTPLNSVIGFSSILLKNKDRNLGRNDVMYLERIQDNGKHLLGLINNVLDLSKVEAGKLEADLMPVDLRVLVQETLAQLEGGLQGKQLKLGADLPRGLAMLTTDRGKLKQILINLVANAIKFTDAGSVTVRVTADDKASPKTIEVVDTGIGIPKDKLPLVFEAFHQGEAGTARKYGGTGLGLTISRSFCQLLGYRIEVHSELGKGSTFTIQLSSKPAAGCDKPRTAALPAQIVAQPASAGHTGEGACATPAVSLNPAAPPTAAQFKDKLVLVIDDEADSRLLLSHHLKELGCEVITASTGADGLELARERRPDLITLDYMMPRLNGWAVLREIKRDPLLQDIPVVIVSVVAEENRGNLLGAVDYLSKPVAREDLVRVVSRDLRSSKGRVLVVDDEEDARRLVTALLSEEGIETKTATNGREALAVLESTAVDLVITDLLMPVMDGTALIEDLRSSPRYRNLPVIVVTGQEMARSEIQKIKERTAGFLKKSGTLYEDLAGMLREVLKKPAQPQAKRHAALAERTEHGNL